MDKEHGDNETLSASKLEEDEELERESQDSTCASRAVIGVPKRYILLLMIFIGFVNIYAMRVNLNVALVAMVNDQTIIRRGVKIIKVCLPQSFCNGYSLRDKT